MIGIALRAAVIVALALAAAALMRRRPAAARHAVIAAGLVAALLVPLLRFAPRWRVAIPQTHATRSGSVAPATILVNALSDRREPSAAGVPSEFGVIIWSFGCLVLLLRVARAHASAYRLLARATRRGDVFVSGEVSAPLTIGLFAPSIVVPRAFDAWPSADRAAARRHESAHVARLDPLVQLVAELARCVYWFNPLVWIACRQLRLECERACDDRVIADGHDAGGYASLLLNVARAVTTTTPAALGIGSTSELERRMVDVLAPNVSRRARRAGTCRDRCRRSRRRHPRRRHRPGGCARSLSRPAHRAGAGRARLHSERRGGRG
jgi:beta-lactamase regulating signal transducer with metallopeptidase domain